jgi:hypothetical protein
LKRFTIVLCVVLVSLVLGWDAAEFSSGYHAAVPWNSLLVFGLTVLASCTVIVGITVALIRRRFQCALALAAALVGSWLLSPWFLARTTFLCGFATRLRQLSNPAEIQMVAQQCLSLMPSGGAAWGPKKLMGSGPGEEEKSQQVWSAISSHSFLRLDGDTCAIFVQPPVVRFEWGGALVGHWGICVRGCGRGSETWQTVPLAEDVALFRGE